MENKNQETPDFQRYQYGALAGDLLEQGSKYVTGALEVLAGEKGLDLGEEAEGFIRGTQSSEEGVKTAIQIYNAKFQKKFGENDISSLGSWYDPVLRGLDKEGKDKILEVLGKHDISISGLREEITKAAYILKAPKELFAEDKKDKAKEVLKRYQEVAQVLNTLDSYKMETLRPDAVNATRVTELKGLASKL